MLIYWLFVSRQLQILIIFACNHKALILQLVSNTLVTVSLIKTILLVIFFQFYSKKFYFLSLIHSLYHAKLYYIGCISKSIFTFCLFFSIFFFMNECTSFVILLLIVVIVLDLILVGWLVVGTCAFIIAQLSIQFISKIFVIYIPLVREKFQCIFSCWQAFFSDNTNSHSRHRLLRVRQ